MSDAAAADGPAGSTVTLNPTWTAWLEEVTRRFGLDVAKASPAVRTLSNAKARIPLTIPVAYNSRFGTRD